MRWRFLAGLVAPAAMAAWLACGGQHGNPTAPAATEAPQRTLPPQPAGLFLEVTSPANDIVAADSVGITIEGRTSPDATLSVDGTLVRPGLSGEFYYEFTRTGAENPLAIEVIASSIAGESASAVLTAVFTGSGVSPQLGPAGDRGVFGTVVNLLADHLTLETGAGEQSLSISDETMVRIPGWASATPQDISPGSPVAVLANGDAAVSVLVQTDKPYQTRHFTGLIVQQSEETPMASVYDGSNLVSVMTGPPSLVPSPGDLATLVLKRDSPSGDLLAVGIDPAAASLDRLEKSMEFHEAAGALDALSNLETRLAENSNRHLSLLFDSMRSAHSPARDSADSVFHQVRSNYDAVLSRFGAGPSTAQISGIVSSIDSSSGREIIVETGPSGPVTIGLSADTPIEFLGDDLSFSQLDLASRVTVRFGLDSAMALWVHVHPGNVLASDVADKLASSAGRGETEGIVLEAAEADGALRVVLQRTGDEGILKFETPPGAKKPAVLLGGVPSQAGPQLAGSAAHVLYDPDSLELLEIDVISRPDATVSGVVQSFIPKVMPGNMTVRSLESAAGFYNHTADTIVRRDGLRVSISEVRVGDIVRPNTRYELEGADRALTVLSLKTPEDVLISGSVRGVTEASDGNLRITIVNAGLDIVTLTAPPSATLTRQGRPMDATDLAVGQEVVSGFYSPVSGLVTSLEVN